MPDLKILTSHPVQYHVPFFRELVAQGVDIDVGYYHQGTAGRVGYDTEFSVNFSWDIELLGGYPHRFFCKDAANFKPSEQAQLAPQILTWALQDRHTPLLLMGWFAELMWLVWLLRIMWKAPILVMSETTEASFASTPKPAWRVALLRWLLQNTTANLYIGNRNYSFLRSMGVKEEHLFYAPYSIDNARFEEEAERELPKRFELCRHYGLNPDKPVFLFCGKLIAKKRPIQLLEAYLSAGLADQAQLIFIGEGALRKELEQRINTLDLKNVHLLGFFNQTQMPLAYVLGELLCLISDATETWGLVVNEALACGRPVIVSEAVGCAPDLVEPANGWMVPLDDQAKLTEVLLIAFNNYRKWFEMGEVGKRKIADHTFTHMAMGAKSAIRFVGEN